MYLFLGLLLSVILCDMSVHSTEWLDLIDSHCAHSLHGWKKNESISGSEGIFTKLKRRCEPWKNFHVSQIQSHPFLNLKPNFKIKFDCHRRLTIRVKKHLRERTGANLVQDLRTLRRVRCISSSWKPASDSNLIWMFTASGKTLAHDKKEAHNESMASPAGKYLRMSSLFTIPHVGEVQFRGNPLRCSAASTLMHLPGLSPSRTNFWYVSEWSTMLPRSWNPSNWQN